MTLDEAVEHADALVRIAAGGVIEDEQRALAGWLRELRDTREAVMSYRKNAVVCPWCGRYRARDGRDEAWSLTGDYPTESVIVGCASCGRRYEVRAERCMYYNTRPVKD